MVERQQNCHLTPAVSLGLFDLHEVWLCREIQTSAGGTAGCCPFPHSDDSGRPAPLEAGSFFMACSKNAVFPGLISLGSNLSLLRNSPVILSQASSGCLGHPQFILVTGGGCFSKKIYHKDEAGPAQRRNVLLPNKRNLRSILILLRF